MDKLERLGILVRRTGRCLVVLNVFLTALLIAGVALHVWATGRPELASDPAQKESAKSREASAITMADVSAATTGKAVFRTNATRKVKVVDELSHYQLMGLNIREGEAKAYVRDVKLKKTLIKKIGDALGSYEITGITSQGLTVKRGAEEAVLSKG